MPHWLGIGDSDAVSETLEKWDNAANDATHKRIRWGIDDEGRAWTSWPSALSLGALSWTSATFRRALGFTGSEVVTTTNSVRLLRGTYPARGVLILRQGLSVMDGGLVRSATSANTAAGRVVGRQAGHWRDLLVTSTLRGGLGVPTALAEVRDEAEIYQTNIWPLLWPGQRVTVCPEWGESRVATTRHAAFAAGAAIQPGNWSARGRHRCEVSTEMDLRQSLSWPRTSGPRILTSPVTWALRELP
jgi:hypothetical protein